MHFEMPPRRLTVDQTVRLDRGFLGLSLALDRDPALQAPLCRPPVRSLAPWVLVENVLECLLETFVGLELVLDLAEDFLRQGLCRRENRDGYLGIAENFLERAGDGDDGRLAVRAGPQINAAVRLGLNLAANVKEPRVVHIGAAEELGQQKELIVAGKQRLVVILQVIPAHHVPVNSAGLLVVEIA